MINPKHVLSATLVAATGVQATSTSWGPYHIQTTTEYPTCPPPLTVNNTQYVSITATTTIFETIIYTDTIIQPTTETQIQLTTETEVQVQLITDVETESRTETVVQQFTETETTPTTITETTSQTVTETTPTTQLLTLTATEEIELYTSTTRLTSLRLCPTRITNPTFTVDVPMPTQWT